MDEGKYHEVKQGECVLSIGEKYGLSWETIWHHPKNVKLKELRKYPNVLYPGDKVFVPDRREKTEDGQTEMRHRFRHKGTPAKVHLRFLKEDGKPRANIHYILNIDGKLSEGETDAEGCLKASIPPNAQKGTVILREGDREEAYKLLLGDMDPVSEESGARKRLQNLGYNCGDTKHDRFEQALKDFQLHHKLEVTGKLDEATQEKLLNEHGC